MIFLKKAPNYYLNRVFITYQFIQAESGICNTKNL